MKDYDSAVTQMDIIEKYSAYYEVNVNYHVITTGCTVMIDWTLDISCQITHIIS